MKKHILALGLLATLILPVFAQDPFEGHIQAIERTSRLLVLPVQPGSTSLSWGQNIANQDLLKLAEAAAALQKRIEEGEEDLDEMSDEYNDYQAAANQVKTSLNLAKVEGEAQTFAKGLLDQMSSVDTLIASNKKQQEAQRLAAARYRSSAYSLGYGNPWGYSYSPWGYGYRPGFGLGLGFGFGFGRGYGGGWGGRCR